MEVQDGLALVFARNAFYKRLHYLALAAFALALIVIFILTSVLLYLLRNPTKPIYFATDNVSRLINVIPINTPNMTKADIINWTIEAVQAAYSYDFINYRAQLQSAQKYFTNYGWRTYMKSLRDSNNLIGIRDRKLIGIATVIETPTLVTEGMIGGAYAWRFRMPLLVSYLQPPKYDDQNKFQNALIVTVIVQRQQVLQGYKGLGILQLIGERATTQTGPAQISGSPT